MKIFVGSDHNGYSLRARIADHLKQLGYEVGDEGDSRPEPNDDYPIFASRVVHAMRAEGNESFGILVCGSGQGMCMAANRFKGIRAALGYDRESARSSRNDDDSNILCLPARTLNDEDALAIVDMWLQTPFAKAARFNRRLIEMDELG